MVVAAGGNVLAVDNNLAVNSGERFAKRLATMACRPIETSAQQFIRPLTILLAAAIALVEIPGAGRMLINGETYTLAEAIKKFFPKAKL